MRSKKYILFVLLSLSLVSYAQQWYHTYVPRSRYVNSVKFLGPETILYGGGNEFNDSLQELWLSNDNGLEWQNVNNINTPPWIKSLAFIDTLKGIAVGYTGTIFKTVNGSYSWRKIASPINRQFNKIIYADTKTMYIAGGSVPRTDTLQTILKSTDSGNTWSVVRDTAGYWLKGIHFADLNHGIAVGDNGTILLTSDAGVHWNKINPPVVRNFNAVKFISSSVGYIVGGKNHIDPFTFNVVDSLSTILRTSNGGSSWSVIKDDSAGILNDITFSNSTTGYAVGDKGVVLKTTDAGLNWSPVILPDIQSYTSFICVEFKNNQLGMIGGRYGDLYVYKSSSLAAAITGGATYKDSTTFTVNGLANTHGETGTFDFIYSLDSNFTTYNFAFYYPGDVKSDSGVLVSTDISGLIRDTTYYYAIVLRTLSGTVYGDTLSFYSSKPTGIHESKTDPSATEGMKVYPNPAKGFVMIENLLFGKKDCTLSLFSPDGLLIRSLKLPAGQRFSTIDVSDLLPGSYLLVMKKSDQSFYKKLILQR